MQTILSNLGAGFDLLVVVLGFGLIVFFHELGHFLAARWAGIRVLAFAIGFGPALLSYRKGLGLRRGSTVEEYRKRAEEYAVQAAAAGVPAPPPGRAPRIPGVSPTEYRLNVLPFGGYVKMLGQEDADPTARSDEPDGYQATPTWKRMVVISAGVVANFALAAVLFVVVFMLGLRTEPAKVGSVEPGSPAALTVAENAKESGVTTPGLQPGDRVLTINGRVPDDFTDMIVATAMSRQGRELRFRVAREGVQEPLVFDITPRMDPVAKLLQIGVQPAVSAVIANDPNPKVREAIEKALRANGLEGVPPGSRLVRVGDDTMVQSAYDIDAAARRSGGKPVELVFQLPGEAGGAEQAPAGGDVTITVEPQRRLQREVFWPARDRIAPAAHILGLMPVLKVQEVVEESPAAVAGIREGDVFAQIGAAEWPSYPEGIAAVRANARGSVRIVVVRDVNGVSTEADLGDVPVTREGTIGFFPGEATDGTRIAAWPEELTTPPDGVRGVDLPGTPPAAALSLMRGSRIVRVNETPVSDFNEIAAALIAATKPALDTGDSNATVLLSVALPVGITSPGARGAEAAVETIEWTLRRADFEPMHELAWASPIPTMLFTPEEFTLKAATPGEAIAMGVNRTQRVMMQTYLTFSRLFQGTVKVEHLRGPVGIAHLGTMVASRGFVHLLFFMALISVNLGVVNFLPVPIADGGHFVFLLYEQITGKPVSVAVQNIASLAGLALILGMFLLVTYNDISRLFG